MENNQNGESQDNLTFEKLTPTHLSDDEMKGYTEALDFVFQEKDLLNIAITGPYASGKSSIVNTYEKNNSTKKGIHISLAYFSPLLNTRLSCQQAVDKELILERKIINQLIHQIKPNKVPATEFKVKNESELSTKLMWTFIISILLFCLIYINKNWASKLFNENFHFALTLIILSFFFISFVAYKIIDLQNGKNLIRKLKIFENEIDISSSECDLSYFDKYLNEIIYILDKSKFDFIVFEDIDRHDDNLILSKLRELNYIYNKKITNSKSKQIKFIYLIKDEIFESKDRTKFFDYILPVIPVLDSSNSLGKMTEIFTKTKIIKDFNSTYLDTLSFFLDDLRLIKNIYNEYIIYKAKLLQKHKDISWFDNEKLLAIIVYKNIFPSDFSLIRLGQGVVHRIISSLLKQSNIIYKNKIENIDRQISHLNDQLVQLGNIYLKNLDELTSLFLQLPQDSHLRIIQIGNQNIGNMSRLELVKKMRESNYICVNSQGYNHSYKEYFDNLEANEEYQERKNILLIQNSKTESLANQIKLLELSKLQKRLPKTTKEIIEFYLKNNFNLDLILKEHIEIQEDKMKQKLYQQEFDNLASSYYFPLLKILISQGYIDEYYNDYTTYFDQNGLSQNDVEFLRNINQRINTDISLRLQNPELVWKKIKIEDLSEPYCLNYSLLEYLLDKNDESVSEYLNSIINQEEYNFIENYLMSKIYFSIESKINDQEANKKYSLKLIEKLNIIDPHFFQCLKLLDDGIYLYISLIVNNNNTLELMNIDNRLQNAIENSSNFLKLESYWSVFGIYEKLPNVINLLKQLKVKFKNILDVNSILLEQIEQNNLYSLNIINVEHILKSNYGINCCRNHYIQSILELDNYVPIKKYYLSNTEKFLESFKEFDIERLDDSEEIFLEVLNNKDISFELKQDYIGRISTIVNKLKDVDDNRLWDALLKKQKILYSDKNIIDYFFGYTDKDENKFFTNILINFINDSSDNILNNEQTITKLIPDKNEMLLFFKAVVTCNELDDSKYEMLISWFDGFKNMFVDFCFKGIKKEKISILIKHKIIMLLENQNLNFIRENYQNNILELIINNFSDYIEKLENNNSLVSHSEIIRLLSENLSLEQNIALLKLTNKPISINNSNYSPEVQKHILENNFDINDLTYITSESFFNSTTNEIQDRIKQLKEFYKF